MYIDVLIDRRNQSPLIWVEVMVINHSPQNKTVYCNAILLYTSVKLYKKFISYSFNFISEFELRQI